MGWRHLAQTDTLVNRMATRVKAEASLAEIRKCQATATETSPRDGHRTAQIQLMLLIERIKRRGKS